MPDPEDACQYECIFGVYALVGGNPPDGYTCPEELGACDVPGDITLGPAVPIEEEPIPDDPPANAAFYTSSVHWKNVYFSLGKADKGFGFLPSLTMEQLETYYPSIAKEVLVLKSMSSLTSFRVTLPALPISVLGRRDE